MKQILALLVFLLPFTAIAQNKASKPTSRIMKMGDETLKQYYFVMLTKGPQRGKIKDTAVVNNLQRSHLANIDRLYNEGKILVAGPFGDDGNWRGLFIFDCDTQAEVEQLLNTDPMIKAGWLAYEVHPWWTGMNSVFK